MSSFILSRFLVSKEISSILHRDFNFIQVCGYAARKGTRDKMRKNRVKFEVKKVAFIPHNLREKKSKDAAVIRSKRIDDSFKRLDPVDDVFIGKFYQWKVYDFQDAVACHRESHHPQLYNMPTAPVNAVIELDMTGPKKNKFVDSFTRIAKVPHHFDHGQNRSILVFCKTPELKKDAEDAGATLVGDADVIKKVERGDIMLPDFDYVLAHPNILPELVCLRGLLKRKFPNPKLGTLGPNMKDMVTKFRTGIQYSALRDETQLDYCSATVTIGTLDMEAEHLENNMISLISDILMMKPNRPGSFITRILLASPPSSERFKLQLEKYVKEEVQDSDSDSDDEAVSAKA